MVFPVNKIFDELFTSFLTKLKHKEKVVNKKSKIVKNIEQVKAAKNWANSSIIFYGFSIFLPV